MNETAEDCVLCINKKVINIKYRFLVSFHRNLYRFLKSTEIRRHTQLFLFKFQGTKILNEVMVVLPCPPLYLLISECLYVYIVTRSTDITRQLAIQHVQRDANMVFVMLMMTTYTIYTSNLLNTINHLLPRCPNFSYLNREQLGIMTSTLDLTKKIPLYTIVSNTSNVIKDEPQDLLLSMKMVKEIP